MARGVLSFPLTSFHDDGSLDPDGFRAYVAAQIATGPGAVFPACGTGEFFSLDEDEYRQIVRSPSRRPPAACPSSPASATAGPRPPASPASPRRPAPTPCSSCRTTSSPPRRTASSPSWSRSPPAPGCPSSPTSAARSPSPPRRLRRIARIPNVIGLKDGHSDLDRLQRLTLAAPEDFLFFNGAATAEIQARAYATVGVPAYSSAVHAFAPEIANAFFAALRDGDDRTAHGGRLLRDFYVPLVELRDRVPGLRRVLVKAAARLRGRRVGPGARPAHRPSPADLADLTTLLTAGLDLVGAAL